MIFEETGGLRKSPHSDNFSLVKRLRANPPEEKPGLPVLKCQNTNFYSQLDEAMFFEAMERIPAIKKIEGRGPDLFLYVPSRLSNKTLRDIIGLFFRYHVDMRQLAVFLTEKNRPWFHNPQSFWFQKIFSKRRPPASR
jgi:hypothetical protein